MRIQDEDQCQMPLIGQKTFHPTPSKLPDIQLQQWQTRKDNNPQKQVIHKIIYGDTLQGLSLQYNVPMQEIKLRNNIQSDSIYYLKFIIIPNSNAHHQLSKEDQQYLKVQQMTQYMNRGQQQPRIARFYLSQSNWNLQKAVLQYRKDVEWENSIKNKTVTVPLSTYNPLQNYMKKFN